VTSDGILIQVDEKAIDASLNDALADKSDNDDSVVSALTSPSSTIIASFILLSMLDGLSLTVTGELALLLELVVLIGLASVFLLDDGPVV